MGVYFCRIVVSFAMVYHVEVWFRFVRSALLHAVVTCVVLLFGAMPGPCCLRVTHNLVPILARGSIPIIVKSF